MHPSIACLLTGAGRGAVATIGVRGPVAGDIVNRCFTAVAARPTAPGDVRFGDWNSSVAAETKAESVVVARGPDESPSTDAAGCIESWEIHCHGGVAAARRILDDLAAAGAKPVSPDRFQSALGMSLLRREAYETLVRTTTVRTAAIALAQVRSGMEAFARRMQDKLDQADSGSLESIRGEACEALRWAGVGLHLATPWRVVLAGPPNVGKSSLINALIGYRRSITFDRPGTTRDVLEAHSVLDGWPIRFSDTAGIREAADCRIEAAGILSARRELAAADLVLWVRDAGDRRDVLANEPDPSTTAESPVIIVGNKIDLAECRTIVPNRSHARIATSAVTGVGIEQLRKRIIQRLIGDPPPADAVVPLNARQVDCLQRINKARDLASLSQALLDLKPET